jgi:hypothetical protein
MCTACHRELAAIITQGEIDNFDLEFTRSNVALSLKFSIKTLSLLETGALKQTPALSSKPDFLMQSALFPDMAGLGNNPVQVFAT